MNFDVIRNNTRDRYNEVILLFNHIVTQESNDPTIQEGIEVKILRGLAYVHLYGVFEKSINELVSSVILGINSYNVVHFHYIPQFNSIAANSYLKSFKDSSYKSFIPNSVNLIKKLYCHENPSLSETVFANSLQNVWYNTILHIREAFGMKKLVLDPRIRATIDEIVDIRNAIAHGRLSPVVIGQSQKIELIRTKLNLIQNFNDQFIDDFEEYFLRKRFIKPPVRNKY